MSAIIAGTFNQTINNQQVDIPRQLTPYSPIDVAEECIGRDEDLQKLAATLRRSPKVVVVNGLGGIGKTTLAKAWFQQARADYDHFAWIDLAGNDDRRDQPTFSLVETIAYHPTLASNLHLSFGEKEPPAVRFQAIMNALRQLRGHNLLVVDNAEQDLEQPDIKAQMPLPPDWQVIVTSRRQLRGYELLPLDRLSPLHATELFQKHFHGDCPAADLADLLREVDYHTLTVELLAKTLQNHLGSLPLRELTAKLQRRELGDPELQRRIRANHSPEETEVYLHLLTTFDCAGLDAEERLLLARCAALPPGGAYAAAQLEEWLQVTDQGRRQLHETLDRLDRKGWLTRSPENAFALHRMVQQAVLYQLQPGMEELGVLVKTFAQKMDFDTSTNYTLLFQWISYAEQVMSTLLESERGHAELIELMNNLGIVYLNLGQPGKARDLLEAALAFDLRNFGSKHHNIGVRQSNLANVYQDLGQYEKARDLLEAALAADLKNLGPEHHTVAVHQSNLANIYRNLGQYEKAQDLLESALASAVKKFGVEHSTVALRQSNLANVYQDLRQYEKARDLLEAALASDLKNFGPEHPTIATRQSNLGNVYKYLEQYEKARDLLEAALASDFKNFNPDHPKVAVRQSNLALVYKDLGLHEKARDLLEAALASDLKNFGPEHPSVAVRQSNLANVYKDLGQYEKARDLLEAALASDLKNFGPEHPNVAIRRINLGAVFLQTDEKEQARVLFQQAYNLFQKQFGEQHPNTQNAKKWLDHL